MEALEAEEEVAEEAVEGVRPGGSTALVGRSVGARYKHSTSCGRGSNSANTQ